MPSHETRHSSHGNKHRETLCFLSATILTLVSAFFFAWIFLEFQPSELPCLLSSFFGDDGLPYKEPPSLQALPNESRAERLGGNV
jgi:hypothetical protein